MNRKAKSGTGYPFTNPWRTMEDIKGKRFIYSAYAASKKPFLFDKNPVFCRKFDGIL